MAEDTRNLMTGLRDAKGNIWGYKSRAKLASTQRPVGAIVFVHGFQVIHNAVSTWNDFPSELHDSRATAGFDLYFFGHDSRRTAAFSAIQLREFLTALAE